MISFFTGGESKRKNKFPVNALPLSFGLFTHEGKMENRVNEKCEVIFPREKEEESFRETSERNEWLEFNELLSSLRRKLNCYFLHLKFFFLEIAPRFI